MRSRITTEWSLHRWWFDDLSLKLSASLLVDGKELPVEIKSRNTGKLQPGKDTNLRLSFESPLEPAVLRLRLQSPGNKAEGPTTSVMDVLIDPADDKEMP